MHDLIIQAIVNRQVLAFSYKGEVRRVEPHCFGRDRKGHDALRAYQIGKDWRLFHLSEINDLFNTGDGFSGPRRGYKRGDTAMAKIYAQL